MLDQMLVGKVVVLGEEDSWRLKTANHEALNIRHAVYNFKKAWDLVKVFTFKNCWKHLNKLRLDIVFWTSHPALLSKQLESEGTPLPVSRAVTSPVTRSCKCVHSYIAT